MNLSEAQAKAVRRWGKHAFADWFTTEGDPPTREFRVGYFSYPGMGTERMHTKGVGETPEAAFADADKRSA